ncbi:2OG-Fe(II) oxygenase [Hyphococcus sp.]|uniref:2OG-Fe(II) oxygenase n=1 Tax=Hyphococcus sp. TaxID=2038636 RepID=UPI003CCBF786
MADSERFETPYRHWIIRGLFPDDIFDDVKTLEFPAAGVGGVSGKRELHNETRHYFDAANIKRHDSVASIAHAFQAPEMVSAVEKFFNADLEGTFLRIEYAQDLTGFWLEPHTDLGVKRLTLLIYVSDNPAHEDMGTDIYNADKTHAKRSPFAPNTAMAFVPGGDTYHGFEKREIPGVRKSLILNYVTTDWRDREQLCFPQQTVSRA